MPRRTRKQRRTKRNYKKFSGFSEFKMLEKLIFSSFDFDGFPPHTKLEALEWLCQKIECDFCACYMVEMATDACCTACFQQWAFLNDGRKCPLCLKETKDAMTKEQANTLCKLVGLNTKQLGPRRHYTQALIKNRLPLITGAIPN
ncbi:uncharacterized protein LOC112604055 [Melanaphis sacchari]|uniref:uncharacterized protein LOC112604055 n=1 Tax=Melanaphis sacchari TaxID=742174 RepID=UPI000DC13346|nr:uncharacterized protein LOC112604055 [Melanaphis sacchari]